MICNLSNLGEDLMWPEMILPLIFYGAVKLPPAPVFPLSQPGLEKSLAPEISWISHFRSPCEVLWAKVLPDLFPPAVFPLRPPCPDTSKVPGWTWPSYFFHIRSRPQYR